MKKSKAIAIGLLTLSIAACHRHRERRHETWDQYNNNPNYYVNDGNGYHHGGISPFWIYWAYRMGQGNRIYSSPGYVYRGYSGGYHSTEFGHSTGISRGSVSRGGFGFSGSHASA